MSVREITHSGAIECTDSISVIFGLKLDTIGFLFNGKIINFYNPTKKAWKPFSKDKRAHLLSISRIKKRDERTYLLQDKFNELYAIRFLNIAEDGGVLIFISNVRYGYPAYLLSTNEVCF